MFKWGKSWVQREGEKEEEAELDRSYEVDIKPRDAQNGVSSLFFSTYLALTLGERNRR